MREIQILEAYCEHTGPDEFGEVRYAHLLVSAKIVLAQLHYPSEEDGQARDEFRARKNCEAIIKGARHKFSKFYADFDIFAPGRYQVLPGQEVYIVDTGEDKLLLLRRSKKAGNRAKSYRSYRRLGVVEVAGTQHWEWFKDVTVFKFV
jgi:hypothetical protein